MGAVCFVRNDGVWVGGAWRRSAPFEMTVGELAGNLDWRG